jgi:hypothetical protein
VLGGYNGIIGSWEYDYNLFEKCISLASVTLGAVPPSVSRGSFLGITTPQTITVKVPSASVSAYNAKWVDGFRGKGFSVSSSRSGTANTNITVIIEGI